MYFISIKQMKFETVHLKVTYQSFYKNTEFAFPTRSIYHNARKEISTNIIKIIFQ